MNIPATHRLQRRPFVASLLARREGALVATGLGAPTWDCAAAGDSPEYFYSWGAMGLCVSTALGIALARPERRVLALTGDGEMMMGIGSLGVVAAQAPANLAILVLDNESFGETGQQPGLTAGRADLTRIAEGFGIAKTRVIEDAGNIESLADWLFREPGPLFAVAKIAMTDDPLTLPIKDGVAIARRFQVALGLEKA